MDPLSDIIALLRPTAAVSKPIGGRGRWGVRYAAHDAPGFAIILKGHCWLSFEGSEPIHLQEGDFFLLPSTPPFTLSSHPNVESEFHEPTNLPVRHGEQEGEAEFESLGGSFKIEQINASLLLALLPRFIHVPASEGRSDRLGAVVRLIMDECSSEEPGKDMSIRRMLEILLIEALRRRGAEQGGDRAGLLHGMRDQNLARVLSAMHSDVRSHWTVADLARVAGQSRSAFAARFNEMLGCGPIEYLARWRMALAKDALLRGAKTLDRIADEIGYESASSFSTAFRKRLGCSPGQYTRSMPKSDEMDD